MPDVVDQLIAKTGIPGSLTLTNFQGERINLDSLSYAQKVAKAKASFESGRVPDAIPVLASLQDEACTVLIHLATAIAREGSPELQETMRKLVKRWNDAVDVAAAAL